LTELTLTTLAHAFFEAIFIAIIDVVKIGRIEMKEDDWE
jgi:hypothetical protein